MKMNNQYIKITKNFIDNFITPLANVTDKAPFKVSGGKISVSCKNPSGEISLNYVTDIETNIDEVTFNVPDLVKFKNLISKSILFDENDKLYLENNKFSYTSSKWRFKYHLLDSALLKYREFNPVLIDNFDTRLSFIIRPEVLKDVVKLKTFHKNKVEKVYFNVIDDKIFVSLTDKTIINTDDLSVIVSDKFEIDEERDSGQNAMKFDMIKILSQHRGVPFKIKCSETGFLIQTKWNDVEIKYIISKLLK